MAISCSVVACRTPRRSPSRGRTRRAGTRAGTMRSASCAPIRARSCAPSTTARWWRRCRARCTGTTTRSSASTSSTRTSVARGSGSRCSSARWRVPATGSSGSTACLEQQEAYERSGFELAHRNTRYESSGGGTRPPGVVDLDEVPRAELLAYDASIFGTRRDAFLETWIGDRPPGMALAVRNGDGLCGYAIGRRCRARASRRGRCSPTTRRRPTRCFAAWRPRPATGSISTCPSPTPRPRRWRAATRCSPCSRPRGCTAAVPPRRGRRRALRRHDVRVSACSATARGGRRARGRA